jgi:hypothetical protein
LVSIIDFDILKSTLSKREPQCLNVYQAFYLCGFCKITLGLTVCVWTYSLYSRTDTAFHQQRHRASPWGGFGFAFAVRAGYVPAELLILWRTAGQNDLTDEWMADSRDSPGSGGGCSKWCYNWDHILFLILSKNKPFTGQHFLKCIYTPPSWFLPSEHKTCAFIHLLFFFKLIHLLT